MTNVQEAIEFLQTALSDAYPMGSQARIIISVDSVSLDGANSEVLVDEGDAGAVAMYIRAEGGK